MNRLLQTILCPHYQPISLLLIPMADSRCISRLHHHRFIVTGCLRTLADRQQCCPLTSSNIRSRSIRQAISILCIRVHGPIPCILYRQMSKMTTVHHRLIRVIQIGTVTGHFPTPTAIFTVTRPLQVQQRPPLQTHLEYRITAVPLQLPVRLPVLVDTLVLPLNHITIIMEWLTITGEGKVISIQTFSSKNS